MFHAAVFIHFSHSQIRPINELIDDIQRKPLTISPLGLFEINPSLISSVKR